MDIKYLGHSSFLLKGKSVSVVTDPYDSASVGFKFPKHIAASVVTVSHDHSDHNAVGELEGNPFVVKGPGEYEIQGVGVVGVSTFHDAEKGKTRGKNTIYRIEIDGLNIVHLGDLGHTLTTADVDALDGVDILMIPVGGVYTIDASTAANVVSEIEPSLVIPMHYQRTGLDPKMFGALSPVDIFLKEMGKEGIAPQPKLSITKDKIPEQMQVVVLE